jgi:hypothetical protein
MSWIDMEVTFTYHPACLTTVAPSASAASAFKHLHPMRAASAAAPHWSSCVRALR